MIKSTAILMIVALLSAFTPSPLYPGERAGVRGFEQSAAPDPGAESKSPSPRPSPLSTGERGLNGGPPITKFAAVDVFVDSGAAALAAYQFELKVTAGNVTLVGVEGGEHSAFSRPPYYDPAALAQQRIVVAAFDTGSDLPRGKTRVARLMVRVSGDAAPAYDATLAVAASPEAKHIPATLSVADAVADTSGSEGAER